VQTAIFAFPAVARAATRLSFSMPTAMIALFQVTPPSWNAIIPSNYFTGTV
jgi:hypothetical protein